MDIVYDDDFGSVDMYDSTSVSQTGDTVDDFDLSTRSPRRAKLTGGSPSRSLSPPRVSNNSNLLRVGTPGVAMSRSSSARTVGGRPDSPPRSLPSSAGSTIAPTPSDDACSVSDDGVVEEERDDVEHTLSFKSAASSTAVFRVKTFREMRRSARRQFDGSCVLLGAGLDGGGQAYAVHRFPLARDEVTAGGESGVTAHGSLAPSVVRVLRSRFAALAKVPANPHVLKVYGAAVASGALFCASAFAAGGSLLDVMVREEGGPTKATIHASGGDSDGVLNVPEPLARLVLLHALRGLRHLHEHGTAHGAVHVRNVFFDAVAGDGGSDLSDASQASEASLLAALGGFAEAVVGGKAAAGTAADAASTSAVQHKREGGHGAAPGKKAWGDDDDDLADDIENPLSIPSSSGSPRLFSPQRKVPQPAAAALHQMMAGGDRALATKLGGGGDDTSRTPAMGISSFESDLQQHEQHLEATTAFVSDLLAFGRLFDTLFTGFTATGDPADLLLNDAQSGADDSMLGCSAESIGGPRNLSPAAVAFQRTLRDVKLSASMAVTAASRRQVARRSAAEASVERLDALLDAPFLEPADVAKALRQLCSARSSHASPGGAPLPRRIVAYAREQRKEVALECARHRYAAGGVSSGSFRFGSARANVAAGPGLIQAKAGNAFATRQVPKISEPVAMSSRPTVGSAVALTARGAAPVHAGLQGLSKSPLSRMGPPSGRIPGVAVPAPHTGRAPQRGGAMVVL